MKTCGHFYLVLRIESNVAGGKKELSFYLFIQFFNTKSNITSKQPCVAAVELMMYFKCDLRWIHCFALHQTQRQDSTIRSSRTDKDDAYTSAIATKAQGANSFKGALSQFCPQLYPKRRGSFSSIASQRMR